MIVCLDPVLMLSTRHNCTRLLVHQSKELCQTRVDAVREVSSLVPRLSPRTTMTVFRRCAGEELGDEARR